MTAVGQVAALRVTPAQQTGAPTLLERLAARLRVARRRHPLAVLPGELISPMDAQRTVSIPRALIRACDAEIAAAGN